MQNKKINFILPFRPKRPTGGFRIMYEYANRLAEKGYSIHLYYPIKTGHMEYRLPYLARVLFAKIDGFSKHNWFKLNPSIRESYIPNVANKYIEDADSVIATWWSTALEMGMLSQSKGKKINFIQGFENWTGHEDLLFKSYDMPETTNVVVASYLKDIVSTHSKNKLIVIQNSIDNKVYKLDNPIKSRSSAQICMMYSEQEIKGTKYGMEALHLVKEQCKNLKVDLFGIFPEPENLPDWITYHHDPSNLPEIYNNNSVFISNSLTEGMALTPLESMFCGCALICTNIDGHKEYAIDKETCLLVETENAQDVANKLLYLIEYKEERINIAQRGYEYTQRFSWNIAVDKMEEVINQA